MRPFQAFRFFSSPSNIVFSDILAENDVTIQRTSSKLFIFCSTYFTSAMWWYNYMKDIFNWSRTNNYFRFLFTSLEYQNFALSATSASSFFLKQSIPSKKPQENLFKSFYCFLSFSWFLLSILYEHVKFLIKIIVSRTFLLITLNVLYVL